MCFSLGRCDWLHTIVFPGKVVTSLPFASLALEILVLSVTCSCYFDALDTMIHTFGRPEECSVWTKAKHSSTNSHFFLIHMLVTHDLGTDHHWIPQIAEGREDLVLKIETRDKFRRSSTKKETVLAWLIHLLGSYPVFQDAIMGCHLEEYGQGW